MNIGVVFTYDLKDTKRAEEAWLKVIATDKSGRFAGQAGAAIANLRQRGAPRESPGPPRPADRRRPGSRTPPAARRHAMNRKINFNAGPAALPLPALERARDEFLDFAGSGMSVMEHSHRGKEYEAVHDEAIALVRELLGVPATHEVLLLQGGATALFALIPMNFLEKGKAARYVVTGAWGQKALGEAKIVAAMFGARARPEHRHRRREGEELHPRPGPLRGEGRRGRRLPAHHLQRDDPRRRVQRRSVPRLPRPPAPCRSSRTCRATSSGARST